MTKISQQPKTEVGVEQKVLLPHEEEISRDLLLRSDDLTEKILDDARQHNDEEFQEITVIDRWEKSTPYGYATKKIKSSDMFVDPQCYDTYWKRKKIRWLDAVQNKRSGAMFSLQNLVKNGVIAEEEVEYFHLPEGIQDYPYRQINVISKVKRSDSKTYFSTTEQWVGLTSTATVVTCPVMDMYWYQRPKVMSEPRTMEGGYLPQGHNITEQITKRALIVKTTGYNGEIVGDRIYTHEWSEEIFRSALQPQLIRGGKNGIHDKNNGCAMYLLKEDEKTSVLVKTVEEMIAPFDDTWKRLTAKETTFKLDPKDFAKQFGPDESADKSGNKEEPYK